MGKGNNFISSFVNGRSDPSFNTFWSYLIESGFDIEPLMNLKITYGDIHEHVKTRNELISFISSIENNEVLQAIAEVAYSLVKLHNAKYKKTRPPKN